MSSASTIAPSSSGAPAAGAALVIPAPLSIADNMKKINNFEVWILDCLIRLYLQPNQRVAEFCCGNGIILSRLMVDMLSNATAPKTAENAFLLSQYYGLEGDAGSAKNKWITKDTPFNAEFLDVDVVLQPVPANVSSSSSPIPFLPASSLDIIFCVKSLARCGASRTALRCFLSNVSRSLKLGGLFIGTLFDPQAVWYKITKRDRESGGVAKAGKGEKGEGVVTFGPGYKLDFPTLPRSNATFTPFTTNLKFYFQLLDAQQKPAKNSPPFSSFLIHLPSLVEEAKAAGLEVVSLQNCAEFLQEQKEIDELEQTLRKLNLQSSHQNPNLLDLFSLNMIYVFKKVEDASNTNTPTNGVSSNGVSNHSNSNSIAMEE